MLSLKELNERMSKLSGWSLEDNSITKIYTFDNFKDSIEFINKLAEEAEKQEHHPDIMINFNRVKLKLTTHSEGGLTEKDIKLAEEIDKID